MPAKKPITILAIETSCDETAASVLRGTVGAKAPQFEVLSSVVKSQMHIHSKFGGVVPELQARAHVKYLRPVVERALADAGVSLFPLPYLSAEASAKEDTPYPSIDYIAVTAGPGLIASLLVGVEFTKGLSLATGIPMIAVNHMEGHLYSPFGAEISNSQFPISNDKTRRARSRIKDKGLKIEFPILSMIVSGGHTLLVLQKNESHYQVLGSTVDDAAGEAFDKVAKLLELPYPGGPQISKLAELGEPTIKFPRPMIDAPNFDFSFSGLKTAVLYYLKEHYEPVTTQRIHSGSPPTKGKASAQGGSALGGRGGMNLHQYHFGHIPLQDKANIARSFEEAVVDVLVTKAIRAAKKYGCKTISLAGGVAANKRLRAKLKVESEKLPRIAGSALGGKIIFIVPDFRLCTDNAEMIALAGYFKLRAGHQPVAFDKVRADSGWEIE